MANHSIAAGASSSIYFGGGYRRQGIVRDEMSTISQDWEKS